MFLFLFCGPGEGYSHEVHCAPIGPKNSDFQISSEYASPASDQPTKPQVVKSSSFNPSLNEFTKT